MRFLAIVMVATCAVAGAAADERVPLIEAVRRQAAPEIAALIARRVDVNAAQPDGATALHWAAHLNDVDAVKALLRAGADVNAVNQLGATTLYLACVNRNEAIVDALLAAGGNPNAALASGETVLMTASRTGNAKVVAALLARGANPNARERSHGQTPLMWASAAGHADVVAALLTRGADVRARSQTRPRRVLVGMRAQMASFNNTVLVDLGGFTPLLFAAIGGNVDVAKALLAAGADPNEETPAGATALVLAAHSGHGALGRFLLDTGADPNADKAGYTALHAALLRRDPSLITTLLAHGARSDVPLAKGTPVGYFSRDFAISAQFLGATPFWLAAQYLEPDLMRELAAAGANPRLVPNNGTPAAVAIVGEDQVQTPFDRRGAVLTPAEVAATPPGEEERLALRTLEAAAALGVDVTAAGGRAGETALHRAAARGYLAVSAYLLEKGTSVNAQNAAGDTPLHVAVANGQVRAIELLAAKGGDLRAKNKKGQTPLAAALAPLPSIVANAELEQQRREAATMLRTLGSAE